MKKLISFLLILSMLVTSAAMADAARVGVLSGPTGMGLAELMSKENNGYSWQIYSAPTNATADLASGALDFLCLPTNTAAALAMKQQDYVTVVAVNCLGSLYLLTDADTSIQSIADLDGKTIYASVPSSSTKPILETILQRSGVSCTIEWEADHDALAALVMQGAIHVAVLPEPKATVAMSKAQGWRVALNISECWNRVVDTPLPMGCVVVRNSFLKENPQIVADFAADCAVSIGFIGDAGNRQASADMIAATGILPSAGVAAKALANLQGSIVCLRGEEMKMALQGFYDVIGQPQPDNSFYYGMAE